MTLPRCPCCGRPMPAPKVDPAACMDGIVETVNLRVIFSSSELKEHVREAGGPLQQLIGNLSAQSLGLVLADMRDKNINGYILRKHSKDKRGSNWLVDIAR